MATTIRVTCGICGNLKLSSEDITLRTCVGRDGGEYRWMCKCGIVVKQAEQPIIVLLRGIGVKEESYELPLELIERPLDGILCEDGLIDLALAFEDGSAYDKIIKKW